MKPGKSVRPLRSSARSVALSSSSSTMRAIRPRSTTSDFPSTTPVDRIRRAPRRSILVISASSIALLYSLGCACAHEAQQNYAGTRRSVERVMLERQLCTELKLSRQTRPRRQAEGRFRGERGAGAGELRVVENVESLRAQLQANSLLLVEVYVLRQVEVRLVATEESRESTRRVSVRTCQRRGECCGIKDVWQTRDWIN